MRDNHVHPNRADGVIPLRRRLSPSRWRAAGAGWRSAGAGRSKNDRREAWAEVDRSFGDGLSLGAELVRTPMRRQWASQIKLEGGIGSERVEPLEPGGSRIELHVDGEQNRHGGWRRQRPNATVVERRCLLVGEPNRARAAAAMVASKPNRAPCQWGGH
nr:unnamed protein product [Digitaria exilis]